MRSLARTGWALLTTSALTNVVLLIRAPNTHVPTSHDVAVHGEDAQHAGSDGRRVDPVSAEPTTLGCMETLRSLEAQIDALSRQLRRVLPLHRVFQLGEPNPAAERLLRPPVDRAFVKAFSSNSDAAAESLAPPYALECRDIVCQLVFVQNIDASSEPLRATLRSALRGRKHGPRR